MGSWAPSGSVWSRGGRVTGRGPRGAAAASRRRSLPRSRSARRVRVLVVGRKPARRLEPRIDVVVRMIVRALVERQPADDAQARAVRRGQSGAIGSASRIASRTAARGRARGGRSGGATSGSSSAGDRLAGVRGRSRAGTPPRSRGRPGPRCRGGSGCTRCARPVWSRPSAMMPAVRPRRGGRGRSIGPARSRSSPSSIVTSRDS